MSLRRLRGAGCEDRALEAEQALLALEAAAVPDQLAGRADDAMAGEHDRDAVPVHHRADGARGARIAGPLGELAVRRGLAVRHLRELGEDAQRELGQTAHVEREVERGAAAGEVVVELAAGLVERAGGTQDAPSRKPRERLELVLGVGIERDAREPVIGHRGQQGAELAVDHVVSGVEQVGARRGVAETAIEVGGNGHVILLRRRRTPDEAACRAASALESSTAAICS